jgi:8-oxo-dGTP pyrophosphatase MutT (NUDIX family)
VPTPDYVAAIRRAYGQGRLLLPGVSAVVVRTDLAPGNLHLLLTRRSDTGRWSLPSGIVEPFEQPAATMLRELYEETRVIAQVERLALLTTDPDVVYPNGDRCQFVAMCFRCQYVSGEAEVGDEESLEVGWFAAHELPEDLGEIQRRRIHCALENRDGCVFDV